MAQEKENNKEKIGNITKSMLLDVKIKVIETLTIEIPKGFMNTGVSTCNHFIADTNDSANWDTIKFPLPKGKWSIQNIEGKIVTLVRTE